MGTAETNQRSTVIRLLAVDPVGSYAPEALLACALKTVGVEEDPRFPFREYTEKIEGKDVRMWQWMFQPQTTDGSYRTAQLKAWWDDPSWAEANPAHEFAVVIKTLRNFAICAQEIRGTVSRQIIRRGDLAVFIPATATAEERAHLIDILEGRKPFEETSLKPEPVATHGS